MTGADTIDTTGLRLITDKSKIHRAGRGWTVIHGDARAIIDAYGGQLPVRFEIDQLLRVRGVGPRTAEGIIRQTRGEQ